MAIRLVFWFVAIAWLLVTLRSLRDLIALRVLPRSRTGGTGCPRVSIVVAARDEAARIEATVRGLLAQQGVDLDLIVVDDRSTDGTGAILAALAADERRLAVVRVDELPAGWLGKCHACHIGAALASGEWILFTDGDIWLQSDVVVRAIEQAEAEGAEHVTLMPGVRTATLSGAIMQVLFSLGMARRAAVVNRDRPGAFLGIGAFNLVRAATYHAIGGHRPLRMEVADDLKLAMLIGRAHGRSRVYFAPGDADADWCPSIIGLIRGLEKNHFAVTGYRLSRVGLCLAMIGLFWGAGIVGPWSGTLAGMAAGLGLMSVSVPAMVAAFRLRWPLLAGLLVPLFLPTMGLSLANSAIVTVRNGGVRWRDTFYPLTELRAGVVW